MAMKPSPERQRRKLEGVAEHVRTLCPEHTWKVLAVENERGTFVLLRGVSGTREPKLEDRICLDLFASGEVVICNKTPTVVGHISMRGKSETIAKRFYETLGDAFDGEPCPCPSCTRKRAGTLTGDAALLKDLALSDPSLWVDFSAQSSVH